MLTLATDVSGFDPLSVSLRDYIDGIQEIHVQQHQRERDAVDLHTIGVLRSMAELEDKIYQQFNLNDKALQAALTSQQLAVAAALGAAGQAVEKAERANEKRFDAVNAFREQLQEQANTFMPRELAQAQFEDLRGTLLALHSRLDIIQGNSKGVNATLGYVIAGATIVISLVAVILTNVVK